MTRHEAVWRIGAAARVARSVFALWELEHAGMKVLVDAACAVPPEHGGELREGGDRDARHGAEALEERHAELGPDARELVELAAEGLALEQRLAGLVGEAVGLV